MHLFYFDPDMLKPSERVLERENYIAAVRKLCKGNADVVTVNETHTYQVANICAFEVDSRRNSLFDYTIEPRWDAITDIQCEIYRGQAWEPILAEKTSILANGTPVLAAPTKNTCLLPMCSLFTHLKLRINLGLTGAICGMEQLEIPQAFRVRFAGHILAPQLRQTWINRDVGCGELWYRNGVVEIALKK
jgi:hypothetical protein